MKNWSSKDYIIIGLGVVVLWKLLNTKVTINGGKASPCGCSDGVEPQIVRPEHTELAVIHQRIEQSRPIKESRGHGVIGNTAMGHS